MICASYERHEDVEDILDKAQAQIFSIASLQNTKTFSSMEELLLRTFQRAEELHENKQGITGLSTGFPDLDKLTYGLSPPFFIMVLGMTILRSGEVVRWIILACCPYSTSNRKMSVLNVEP